MLEQVWPVVRAANEPGALELDPTTTELNRTLHHLLDQDGPVEG